MDNEYKWLPELEGTVPKEAYGYAISNYAIAYEAWRRGLNITFEKVYHNRGMFIPKYTIYSKNNKVQFSHTRPHLVSKQAIKICVNKQLTREALDKENIPVPKGMLLKSLDETYIKKATSGLNFPLVVKPLNGRGGRGVITGIDDFVELKENIQYLKNELNFDQIIVEEYIQGEDYRAFVIGDKVVGAFRRLPPHVIGDGKNSIKKLMKSKNDIRVKIPGTYNMRVIINKEIKRELRKQNYTLNSVPSRGQFVRLKTKNNVSSGGDPIDATDELPEEIKNNLVKAVKAIPGLIQGGVDVIYDKKTGRYAILEINTKPSIRNHLYPIKGNAHEIPKAIIDYYFPETKGNYLSKTTPKYYFDYLFVTKYIRNNRLEKFTLPPHPYEPNLDSKLISFKSNKELTRVKQLIRSTFHKLKFNGEMNLIRSGEYELIVAGNYQDIDFFIDKLRSNRLLSEVQFYNYAGPVRIGFTFNNKSMSDPLRLIEENENLNKKVKQLEKELNQLKNSKSWKITSPLRKLKRKREK
ncbi:ATP-grasp domain-containing protein [Virgibacillus sp. YIM 98842]|uniref:ATP-grasp domain-containing protein n=1 Tax=Virgibacillus sp. YIM 98842 TaxID=2663533 RepID=UPI0013DCA2AB|nr:ATP-grasp domain-containing protein [Virgibacillus sp. YIM 98842]